MVPAKTAQMSTRVAWNKLAEAPASSTSRARGTARLQPSMEAPNSGAAAASQPASQQPVLHDDGRNAQLREGIFDGMFAARPLQW